MKGLRVASIGKGDDRYGGVTTGIIEKSQRNVPEPLSDDGGLAPGMVGLGLTLSSGHATFVTPLRRLSTLDLRKQG